MRVWLLRLSIWRDTLRIQRTSGIVTAENFMYPEIDETKLLIIKYLTWQDEKDWLHMEKETGFL